MKIFKYFLVGLVAAVLVACGGGGGNASSPSIVGLDGGIAGVPKISVVIVNSKGVQVSDNSIGSNDSYYAKATVTDANSAAVNTALVSFSVSDATVAKLVDNSALTNSLGVSTAVKVQPASLSSRGAAVLTATSVVGKTTVTTSMNFQVTASNVTLGTMSATPAALGAFQNAAVSVQALVDGVAASAGVVSATFTAKCGSFSPTTASTDGTGLITSTFQPGGTCPTEGITLSATATGSTVTSSKVVSVTGASASTVNFTGASNPLLVARSVGGAFSRSRLTFKVSDSSGNAMGSQQLVATLSQASINASIQFDGATTDPQVITTGADGLATVGVISGDVFVPVVVTMSLKSNPSVSATSYGVAVTSGKATQKTISLASVSASMESLGFDGIKNQLTMSASDRLGNPLPMGTVVNFVTNNGIIGGSTGGTCTLGADSTCTITYYSIGGESRPANGRVAILAYLNGEESFVDANGDNVWQPGEPFEAIGWPYIDANENGVYDAGEQKIGLAPSDTGACTGGYPSVANSCNASAWKGDVIVRKQIIVVQATQNAQMFQTTRRYSDYFGVWISDSNPNSVVQKTFTYLDTGVTPPVLKTREVSVGRNAMPTGSKLSAAVLTLDSTKPPKCAVLSVSSATIPHVTDAAEYGINLNQAADCLTVPINVTLTTPGNSAAAATSTTFTFYAD
jgi:hypothetical protein